MRVVGTVAGQSEGEDAMGGGTVSAVLVEEAPERLIRLLFEGGRREQG